MKLKDLCCFPFFSRRHQESQTPNRVHQLPRQTAFGSLSAVTTPMPTNLQEAAPKMLANTPDVALATMKIEPVTSTNLHLSDTAKGVMLCIDAYNIYMTPNARRFIASIGDCSAGQYSLDRVGTVYGSKKEFMSVIQNRKAAIMREVQFAINHRDARTVIFLAAGCDPLGLHLAFIYPNVNIYEFDIDKTMMDEKNRAGMNLPNYLTFQQDCTRANEVYRKTLPDRKGPVVIVSEGFSYYVPKRVSQSYAQLTLPKDSIILIDHMTEEPRQTSARADAVYQDLWQHLGRTDKVTKLCTVDFSSERNTVEVISGKAMEKIRTKTNEYMKSDDYSAWEILKITIN